RRKRTSPRTETRPRAAGSPLTEWLQNSPTALLLLLRDFRGAKEIVVPCRLGMDVAHSVGVHDYVVERPEIYRRQIAPHLFLNPGVDRFALLLVEFGAGL